MDTRHYIIPILLFLVILCFLPAASVQPQEAKIVGRDEAEALYSLAMQRHREGNVREAARIYTELADRYPTHNRAGCGLVNMGSLFMRLERYDEAIEAFQKALRGHPDSKYENGVPVAPIAAYNISYCFFIKGDVDEGVEAFNFAVERYPDARTADRQKLLYEEFFDRIEKDDRGAEAIKNKKPPEQDDPVRRHYGYAERFRRAQPEKSLKEHQELIAKYPEHNLAGASHANCAKILARFGRYDEAIPHLRTVVEKYPDSHYVSGGLVAADASFKIGLYQYEKGDMENARKAFDLALQKYGATDGGRYVRLYADVIRKVNPAAPLPPGVEARQPIQPGDPAESLYSRGVQLCRENPEEALKAFEELIAKYPKHNRAGCALARTASLFANKGLYDEAIARSRRVLEEYPNSRYGNGLLVASFEAYRIGYYYCCKKDMKNAKKAFDIALEKYGDARTERGGLVALSYGRIIEKLNATAARALVRPEIKEKLEQVASTDAAEQLYVKAGQFRKQRPDEALKIYEELIAEYPDHNRAGCALGRGAEVLRTMGRYDDAITWHRRVLDQHSASRYGNGVLVAAISAYEIGVLYYEKDDMPRAKEALDFALKKYGDAYGVGTGFYARIIEEVNAAISKLPGADKPADAP